MQQLHGELVTVCWSHPCLAGLETNQDACLSVLRRHSAAVSLTRTLPVLLLTAVACCVDGRPQGIVRVSAPPDPHPITGN